MWRPFSNIFASHSYGNFSRKPCFSPSPLRPYKLAQYDFTRFIPRKKLSQKEKLEKEVQHEALKQKVKVQRQQIKLRTRESERRSLNCSEIYRRKQSRLASKRKEFHKYLRSMASNRTRKIQSRVTSPTQSDMTFLRRSPISDQIFALTAAVEPRAHSLKLLGHRK